MAILLIYTLIYLDDKNGLWLGTVVKVKSPKCAKRLFGLLSAF